MPASPVRIRIGVSQAAQHFEARHVWQIEVEEDDVVVVDFPEIDPFLAEIGRVDVEAVNLEHQLYRLRLWTSQWGHC